MHSDGELIACDARELKAVGLLSSTRDVGRYDNQDHSMCTACLAVRNMQGATHDTWNVNVERGYHEKVQSYDEEPFDTAGVPPAAIAAPLSEE